MTKDNEDALRCAQSLTLCVGEGLGDEAAAHLRRLVRENEALRSANADLAMACRSWKAENEAKDALLRQAVAVMGLIGADLVCEAAHHAKKDRHEVGELCSIEKRWHDTFQAIRQHLDKKTT